MNKLEIEAENEDAWRALVLNNGTFDSITVKLSNGDRIELCSTWGHEVAADYYEEGKHEPTAISSAADELAELTGRNREEFIGEYVIPRFEDQEIE